jgi:hypothetical protein
MSSGDALLIPSIVPQESSVVRIALADLRSEELVEIVAIWNRRRGDRLMPARDDLLPRAVGRLLRNVSLLKVVPESGDYEFRVVGDVHVQAYGSSHQGARLSDVISEAPVYGSILKATLDSVVKKRRPIAYRGAVGQDVGDAQFVWLETVFLPLGVDGDTVDHVINASVYVQRYTE